MPVMIIYRVWKSILNNYMENVTMINNVKSCLKVFYFN